MKTNKNEVVLPVAYPEVISYTTHAHMFSLFSDHEESLIWFYNNFIQLSMMRAEPHRSFLDFDINSYLFADFMQKCPLIDSYKIPFAFIESRFSSFSEFAISSINEGFYIYFYVDMYEISLYKDYYQNTHRGHDLMLFGYNKVKSTFEVADFFGSNYGFASASFDEINNGYNGCSNLLDSLFKGIILFKKSHLVQTNLDISKVKRLFVDYVNSTNNTSAIDKKTFLYPMEYIYGVEIYDMLIAKVNNNCADIRDFCLLFDHKKILCGLVAQLAKEGILRKHIFIESFSIIKDKTLILRNIMLKNRITNKENKDKIVCMLQQIESSEQTLLNALINDLSENKYTIDKPNICSRIEFVGRDETTKGNWKHKFGALGYDIYGDDRSISNNIQLQYYNAYNWYHPTLCDDVKAPQVACCEGKRIFVLRCDLHNKGFTVDIKTKTKHTINLALYFVGLENTNWSFDLDIIDPYNNEVILYNEIMNITDGVYYMFRFSGNIKLFLYGDNKKSNPYLAGVFFD